MKDSKMDLMGLFPERRGQTEKVEKGSYVTGWHNGRENMKLLP